MNFKKATMEDLQEILKVKEEVVKKFVPLGLNWSESYPSIEHFKMDILNCELYILEDKGDIVASVVLNREEDENYKEVKWVNEGEGLVIHRLMVSPKHSGKGVGKKLLMLIEEMAIKEGLPSVKLDTCTENLIAQKLYTSMNYKFLGEISLTGKNKKYFCLEKVL